MSENVGNLTFVFRIWGTLYRPVKSPDLGTTDLLPLQHPKQKLRLRDSSISLRCLENLGNCGCT